MNMPSFVLRDADRPEGADGVVPVIQAQALRKHYPLPRRLLGARRAVRALEGVGFTLHAGRTVAVVGESGCGKTTLARLLTLVETPTDGTLQLDGKSVDFADPVDRRRLQRRVQMVFQNPFSSLNPRKTLAAILEEPLVIDGRLERATRRQRVADLMQQVGLRADQADRYPHMFSGGQRQRIAIARAMALSPAVIVADEPVSALDVSIQAQILNLFMDLQDRHGTAYVFISHNLSVVEHVAHEVLVMYLGRVVESGPTRQLFERPLHPYTRALMAASPTLGHRSSAQSIPIIGELPSPLSPPTGCAFHPRCPMAQTRCAQELPTLSPRGAQAVACHLA
jgi:dipeptide transport system ATP-binding protein